ncbi:MAG: hypothetical protein LBS86_05935 [Treponema sp.]|jgi:hypothetical protein|nr:hypothetical protein [Treponema sp.]
MPQTAVTLEDVWAVIRETDRQIQASKAEYDRQAAASKEAWERIFRESKAEHDRMIAETELAIQKMSAKVDALSDNVGGMSNSLGDMSEGLMASDLYKKFAGFGLEFDHSIQNYKLIDRKTGRKLTEVDVLLVNGTIALAVEVKTHMTPGDVEKHEARMDILRHEPNSLFINRTLYGAMAGVKMGEEARESAIAKGFYVIELTGNMVKIDMPEGFTPRTW